MPRAFLIVLDSVGCGGASDAAHYGDEGADTLGHIAQACAEGRADRDGVRHGPLYLPHLARLGLKDACAIATGHHPSIKGYEGAPEGLFGAAQETSKGKDTISGHWEIAGAPADFAFGYFPDTTSSFPQDLKDAIIKEAKLPGILGNCHASGTAIIFELGEEHIRSGKPILYTSADSVLQIAAHEDLSLIHI